MLNQRNAPGTHGHRYLAYLKTVADRPEMLRAADLDRLLSPDNMPPSIASRWSDFRNWLLEETLPPRTRKQLREYVDPAESDDSDASAAGMILDGLVDGKTGEAIE